MESKTNVSDVDESSSSSKEHYQIVRTKRGWQGEELEIQRDRETIIDPSLSVAVDLKQFRNEEVGKGYQAKHVIRQPSVSIGVKATGDTTSEPASGERARKTSKKRRSGSPIAASIDRRTQYLNCPAFRQFRKELEKID